MATRSTQSLVLVLAERATAKARDTQSTVIVPASRGTTAARTTQSTAAVVASSTAKSRVTKSAILVLSPPPPPARVTTANLLLAAGRTALARATQAVSIVVGKRVAASKARDTQSKLLLLTGRLVQSKVRATHAVLLALTGQPACASDLDGCGGYSFEKLKERTLRLLGEDPDSPTYWSKDEVGALLNEAYIALCRDSGAYEYVYDQTTTAGQAVYGYPDVRLKRLFYDSRPLLNTTPLEMDRNRLVWGSEGEVWGYITQQQNQLTARLVDVPSEALTLSAWVQGIPDPLEDRCDTPLLPPWSHMGLVYGAAARALGKYGESRSDGLAGACRAMYESYLMALKSYVGRR